MQNILVISGHPNLSISLANRTILAEFSRLCPQAQVRDVMTLYPNLQVKVQSEQDLLRTADVVVLQFPFYWYSLPYPLKAWLDQVFTHGFAHGGGAVLSGKHLVYSFTTGAAEQEYAEGRAMNHALTAYTAQFAQTAALCQMHYHEVHSCGMMYVPGISTEADKERVAAAAREHAARLAQLISSLAA